MTGYLTKKSRQWILPTFTLRHVAAQYMYITMYIIQVYMAQCTMYISYNYTTSFITL